MNILFNYVICILCYFQNNRVFLPLKKFFQRSEKYKNIVSRLNFVLNSFPLLKQEQQCDKN